MVNNVECRTGHEKSLHSYIKAGLKALNKSQRDITWTKSFTKATLILKSYTTFIKTIDKAFGQQDIKYYK